MMSGLLTLGAAPAAAGDAYERMAKAIAAAAVGGGYGRVAVLPLKPVNSRSKQGGLILSERLVSKLAGREGLQVVERTLLEKVLREQRLGTEGYVDPAQARQVGRILGVDALLTGTFLELSGERIELHTRLIDSETARVIGAAQAKVDKEWEEDAFALGESWAVPVPKLEEEAGFSVPSVSLVFRDAPSEGGAGSPDCSGWEERVDALQRDTIESKARYWATRLRDPAFDKASLTRNPGSEIRNMQLRHLFFARTKELYRQGYAAGITLQQQGTIERSGREVERLKESCY